MDTLFNGIMASVALIGMFGSLFSWFQARKEKKSSEDSAAQVKAYYDLMIAKITNENEEGKREKLELEILEYLRLSKAKISTQDVVSEFSLEPQEALGILTHMLRISNTIGVSGNGLSDSRAKIHINEIGKNKLRGL